MKTNNIDGHQVKGCVWGMLASIAALYFSVSVAAGADFTDQPRLRFGGIYRVVSSTDPIFPATATQEYFLDFGRGIQREKLSGSVAVSVRQNPKVQVRIMSWQYFQDQGTIVIGNPFTEGSRRAVAIGAWRMTGTSNGVLFEREGCRVVLRRVDPEDY